MVDPDPAALKRLGKYNINNNYSIYVFHFHVFFLPLLNGQLWAHKDPCKAQQWVLQFHCHWTEAKKILCLGWYFFLRDVEGTPSPFVCGLLEFLVSSAGIVLVVKLVYNTARLFLAFSPQADLFLIKFYLIASLIESQLPEPALCQPVYDKRIVSEIWGKDHKIVTVVLLYSIGVPDVLHMICISAHLCISLFSSCQCFLAFAAFLTRFFFYMWVWPACYTAWPCFSHLSLHRL